MPDSVQHITGFGIHITTTLIIYIVFRYYGTIISYSSSYTCIVIVGSIFIKYIPDKQRFTVIGKAFVYPHISEIFGCNIITKPFVPALMNDDEVPFHSPSCTRSIPATIPGLIPVTIRYST